MLGHISIDSGAVPATWSVLHFLFQQKVASLEKKRKKKRKKPPWKMASSDGRDRKNTPVRKLAIVPNIMLESRSMPSSPTGSNLSLPTQPHVSDPFQKRAMEEISRSTNQFLHIQRALVETTRRSSETPAVPSTFRLNSAATTDSNASSSEDVSITPPGRKTRAFSLTGIEGPLFRKPNFFHRRGSKGGDGQGSTSNLLATALHNVLHKKKYVMKYLYLEKRRIP